MYVPDHNSCPACPSLAGWLQLAVYGKESMRRMATANVLICGLGGLGVEVGECAVC